MPENPTVKPTNLSLLSVPAFWPMAMATAMFEEGTELYAKNLKFVDEEIKIHDELRPTLATPNQVRLDLRTMVLRDYGKPSGIPTLVDAPHAGHTAMVADYHKGQSLIETLLANGIDHVALTDWKSATADMKDLEIDNYLAETRPRVNSRTDAFRVLANLSGSIPSLIIFNKQGGFAWQRRVRLP